MPEPGKALADMTADELGAYRKTLEDYDPSTAVYRTKQLSKGPLFAKLNPLNWLGAALDDLLGSSKKEASLLAEQEVRLNEVAAYQDALKLDENLQTEIEMYNQQAAQFQGEVRAWMMANGGDIRAAGSPAAMLAFNDKQFARDIAQMKKTAADTKDAYLREAKKYDRAANAMAAMRPWDSAASLLSGITSIYGFFK